MHKTLPEEFVLNLPKEVSTSEDYFSESVLTSILDSRSKTLRALIPENDRERRDKIDSLMDKSNQMERLNILINFNISYIRKLYRELDSKSAELERVKEHVNRAKNSFMRRYNDERMDRISKILECSNDSIELKIKDLKSNFNEEMKFAEDYEQALKLLGCKECRLERSVRKLYESYNNMRHNQGSFLSQLGDRNDNLDELMDAYEEPNLGERVRSSGDQYNITDSIETKVDILLDRVQKLLDKGRADYF